MMVIFWVFTRVLQVCSDVLEKCAATIYRVTELVQVDAEVTGKKECVSCIGKLRELWPMRATGRGQGDMICTEAMGIEVSKMALKRAIRGTSPIPSFPFCTSDWPTFPPTFPYNNISSSQPLQYPHELDSLTLKLEAVHSSKTLKQTFNTQCENQGDKRERERTITSTITAINISKPIYTIKKYQLT
jgi:hypothetical protein